jgi:hypothetical protein
MPLLIEQNFRVFVPNGDGREGRVDYRAGMVIRESEVPTGHTTRDWIDKGLVREVGGEQAAEHTE